MDNHKPNPQQQASINHNDGPMLVVAGAGTGKTQVITRRIARLIAENKAKPEEILALTFTDKAAGEMLDRLDTLVGWDAYRVNVMTFHSFGLQLLQRFGHHMGWSTRTEVISEVAKLILLKQNLSKIKLSYYGSQNDILDFLEGALAYIGALQNADVDVEQLEAYVSALKPGPQLHQLDIDELNDRVKLYQLYESLKQEHGLIDYHDQVVLPLQLLQQKPNLVDRLRQQYKYVLVDEYQDTNTAQDALLRALVPADGNIFAVGDDDQAIYGFRGAKLTNILKFTEHFKVKQSEALVENYRSTQSILDAAYKMIRHNDPERLEVRLGLDKKLHAQSSGPEPRYIAYAVARDEYNGIADELAKKLESGAVAEQIAVLATSHNALRALARVLKQRGIAYQMTTSINIFEQPEVVQLWHVLRWVAMMANEEAMAQILLGPFAELSPEKVRSVTEVSRQQTISIEDALEVVGQADSQVKEFAGRLAIWREWAKELPVSQLVYKMIFETGIKDLWAANDSPRMRRVFQDLGLLMNHMQEYEYFGSVPTLIGYLQTFPRQPEIETEELIGEQGGVSLLTIHASKGLEFDTVYIIGNTHDAWGKNAAWGVELPADLTEPELELPPEHERRRLLYVAMTRAKRELLFSAPTKQRGGRERKPSPFLAEVFDPAETSLGQQGSREDSLQNSLTELQRFAPSDQANTVARLPFETADGWLELSTSDIVDYDECPYEFKLKRVLNIRTPAGPQAEFGKIMHGLFQEYYQSRQFGEPLQLDELETRLSERWSVRGYQTAEQAELARITALQTLRHFYRREEDAKRTLRASEEDFKLVIEEAKLRIKGRIDVSFDGPEGIEVRDFKTGRLRDADKLAEKAKNNLQLRTYALAIEAMTGKAPAAVVLDYVVTGTEGIATLTPLVLKKHREKLVAIAEKIRRQEFEPKKDLYHKCVANRYWGEAEEDEQA